MNKINPGHLNKFTFILLEDRTAARKKAACYLPGIKEGSRHLHAYSCNHNNLNPANIMISEDDILVIIDFNTSSAPGIGLDKVKRTYRYNNFDALAELRVWLTGSSPAEF
ncbi:hypothetical protein K469DRAFT_732394 [Zopfia rhizophila CBS 207.26]|uniref:Protein kinase domain-containing protein n=1 Tax=Zopfia rhizophila CBS 207.26 TaxID=1314779 RepID=A0A6A6DJ10_9PEZI|nr:hypothetical protein K469DRAFT_732394 [Zopfia rhizophila CBS 207.26]